MNNRELAEYVMSQLDELDDVRRVPMMGGWLFYYQDRIFGGIYSDGEVLVKLTEASRRHLPDVPERAPYEGSKSIMLRAENLDDKEDFRAMVEEMWPELPERKKKKKTGKVKSRVHY